MDNILLALRVVVSLAVVIGAIWFVQRRVSRGGAAKSKRAGKPMSVVARQNLGPKASVAVVDFGGKRLLLGVTEHGISVLDDAPVEAAVVIEATEVVTERVAASAPLAVTRRASSKQNSRDFAQALGKVADPTPAATPAALRLSQNETFTRNFVPSSSKVAGSILSAATWKQAWIAVRGGR